MPKNQTFVLKAEKRDKHSKAKAVRREDLVPGVVYGHGVENIQIVAPYNQFVKIYNGAGESSLVDLEIDGKEEIKVLIHDISRHPLTNKIIHFDLYQVKMTEKLETSIQLKFIGESPAVETKGGVLIKNLDELEVRCLPGDLVPEIDVDLSPLVDFGAMIKVSDLKIPEGIEILNNKDLVVVSVTEPAKEEEAPSAPVEENVEAVEVVKKEKKEGEEEEKKEE